MRKKAPWTTMPQYAQPATVKARKYIRSRTPKRAREEAEYNRELKEWWKDPKHKYCFACQYTGSGAPAFATECHHWAGRRGDLLLYKPWWYPTCERCHAWIHANIEKAITAGLRAPKNQWNQMPKPEPQTT